MRIWVQSNFQSLLLSMTMRPLGRIWWGIFMEIHSSSYQTWEMCLSQSVIMKNLLKNYWSSYLGRRFHYTTPVIIPTSLWVSTEPVSPLYWDILPSFECSRSQRAEDTSDEETGSSTDNATTPLPASLSENLWIADKDQRTKVPRASSTLPHPIGTTD